jgi:hypothetical protein
VGDEELALLARRSVRCTTHFRGCDCHEHRHALIERERDALGRRTMAWSELWTRWLAGEDVADEARAMLAGEG